MVIIGIILAYKKDRANWKIKLFESLTNNTQCVNLVREGIVIKLT